MLPPVLTHLLQALDDVAFFSLKRSWRVMIDKWKKDLQTEGLFDKKNFPSLLKCLVNTQKQNMKKKLQSGFRACGICPLDHNGPLSKLPIMILMLVKAIHH